MSELEIQKAESEGVGSENTSEDIKASKKEKNSGAKAAIFRWVKRLLFLCFFLVVCFFGFIWYVLPYWLIDNSPFLPCSMAVFLACVCFKLT